MGDPCLIPTPSRWGPAHVVQGQVSLRQLGAHPAPHILLVCRSPTPGFRLNLFISQTIQVRSGAGDHQYSKAGTVRSGLPQRTWLQQQILKNYNDKRRKHTQVHYGLGAQPAAQGGAWGKAGAWPCWLCLPQSPQGSLGVSQEHSSMCASQWPRPPVALNSGLKNNG